LNSGSGLFSFFQPRADESVATVVGPCHGMACTGLLCTPYEAHRGQVFEDGPGPARLRYCVNSAPLAFTDGKELTGLATPSAELSGSTAS
jgi:peptide-methionine (R)-S-oxide reductase